MISMVVSVKPKYCRLMEQGKKKAEFRKVRPRARSLQTMWVYATEPVGKVIGYCLIKDIDEGTPQEMWQKYHAISGMTKAEYDDYYQGKGKAVVILYERFEKEERKLSNLGAKVAPQSYFYTGVNTCQLFTGFQPFINDFK